MNKKLFFALIMFPLVTLFPLFAVAQNGKHTFTLEQSINYALEKNFSQQSLRYDKAIQQSVLDQSKLELLPDLKANLSHGVTNSNSDGASWNGNYGISSSVILYDGGKNVNTIKINRLSLAQVDSKIIQAQNQLAIDVVQAFLEVAMNEELYNFLTVAQVTSKELAAQGKIKCSAGKILESDYLLLEAQAATDHFNVVNTQVSRDNSILNLKMLLSMPSDDTLEISIPDINLVHVAYDLPSLDEVVARTFEWLPDLKIARQSVAVSSLNIKQAKSLYLPTLSLGGSIGTGYLGGGVSPSFGTQLDNRFNQQLTATLSIPLWNKGATRAQVKQANYRLKQSELSQQSTELQLRQELAREYNNVSSGYQKYIASEMRTKAFLASANAYRVQFEMGQITAVDMLQQETSYLSALNDFIQNKYSYILGRKLLDVYMGVKIEL